MIRLVEARRERLSRSAGRIDLRSGRRNDQWTHCRGVLHTAAHAPAPTSFCWTPRTRSWPPARVSGILRFSANDPEGSNFIELLDSDSQFRARLLLETMADRPCLIELVHRTSTETRRVEISY